MFKILDLPLLANNPIMGPNVPAMAPRLGAIC
jgi:hypothetical protein